MQENVSYIDELNPWLPLFKLRSQGIVPFVTFSFLVFLTINLVLPGLGGLYLVGVCVQIASASFNGNYLQISFGRVVVNPGYGFVLGLGWITYYLIVILILTALLSPFQVSEVGSPETSNQAVEVDILGFVNDFNVLSDLPYVTTFAIVASYNPHNLATLLIATLLLTMLYGIILPLCFTTFAHMAKTDTPGIPKGIFQVMQAKRASAYGIFFFKEFATFFFVIALKGFIVSKNLDNFLVKAVVDFAFGLNLVSLAVEWAKFSGIDQLDYSNQSRNIIERKQKTFIAFSILALVVYIYVSLSIYLGTVTYSALIFLIMYTTVCPGTLLLTGLALIRLWGRPTSQNGILPINSLDKDERTAFLWSSFGIPLVFISILLFALITSPEGFLGALLAILIVPISIWIVLLILTSWLFPSFSWITDIFRQFADFYLKFFIVTEEDDNHEQ